MSASRLVASRAEPSVSNPADRVTAPPTFNLRLFDSFALHLHGTPMRALRTRHGARLLALLALANGQEQSRATLAGRLWPDSPSDDAAAASLRRALTDLRDALGSEAGRLQSPTFFALRLDLSGDAVCDVRGFDRAVGQSSPAAWDYAIELYRGPLMPDLDAVLDADGALRGARDERHQAFLGALEHRADARRKMGEAPLAIADLRRLLIADPTREPASVALMELLATDMNDRVGAMAEYTRLRRALNRELGIEPAHATRALHESIQKNRLGKSGRPTSNGSTVSTITPRHNLPTRLTRFIGREAVDAAVRGLLRENRLLTLTGMGGAGKTRLAQHVAADALEDFPDGVWQVELAALPVGSDASLVLRAAATALGVREQAGQSLPDTLIARLAPKRLLLLLDNCEHLLDACARVATVLLEACPGVTILATSREPIGVLGEQNYRVPSLTMPDTEQVADSNAPTAAEVAAYEAVRLFVDRAALASHDFALDDSNARPVARLCQRLDGIPLALELAAARTRSFSVEQMVERLDDRFDLLASGNRAALPRQQTLLALVDWSYDLLVDDEKTLFARLSVFAGGWTTHAAKTVCGAAPLTENKVSDLLTSLVAKSIVQAEEQADGSTRYRMLETLRQYAAEKIDLSSEATDARERHRDWCVALAEEADAEIFGSDQLLWLTRLETDYANLRAALNGFETAFQDSQSTEIRKTLVRQALRLTVSLGFFWQVRGYTAEAHGHFAWILRASQSDVKSSLPASMVARAFCMAANLALQQGGYEEARGHFTASLALYRALGEPRNVALVLGNLGSLAANQNDWESAWTLMKEALDIARSQDDKISIAAALCNLGDVATNRGENRVAWELLTESLELFRAVGENHGIAMTLNNLGDVAVACDDCAAAQPLFEEALDLRRALEDRRGIWFSLRGLAEVRLTQGDAENAVVLWAAADALRESIALNLRPLDRAKYDRGLDRAQTTLIAGSKTAFDIAWKRGRALTWEQAVAYALGESHNRSTKV